MKLDVEYSFRHFKGYNYTLQGDGSLECHFVDIDGEEVVRTLSNLTIQQIESWANGELIQNAMPNLTAEERELFMTGLTPEKWSEIFGEEE